MVIYLASRIKMGEGMGEARRRGRGLVTAPFFPDAPIIHRLNPLIDGVVFRMLRHDRGFAPDFRQDLRIAEIKVTIPSI